MRVSYLGILLLLTGISASMSWLDSDFRVPVAQPTTVPRRAVSANSGADLSYLLSANHGSVPETQSALTVCDTPCPLSHPDDGPLPKPYRSSREFAEDLEHRDHWVKHMLVMPVHRGGKPLGIRLKFRTSMHPFGRLGFRNGDIVLSVNGHSPNEAASSPMRFRVERAGKVCSVVVDLH